MTTFFTSADGTFTLTFSAVFNAPCVLENWGTDRAFEQEAVEMAESRMSIDGKLNRGFVVRQVTQTITLSSLSSSVPVLEAIIAYQRQQRTLVSVGAELILPSLKRRYTFVNGCLTSGSIAPTVAATVEDRTFTFSWEDIKPIGI